jgi:hypothetical protein
MPVIGVQSNKLYKEDILFNSRIRYWSRWLWPLSGKMNFQKGFYGGVQDEFIFNMTGSRYTNKMFFDQVRAYTGLGYKINKKMDVEAGYMFMCLVNKEKESMITNAVQITTAFKW